MHTPPGWDAKTIIQIHMPVTANTNTYTSYVICKHKIIRPKLIMAQWKHHTTTKWCSPIFQFNNAPPTQKWRSYIEVHKLTSWVTKTNTPMHSYKRANINAHTPYIICIHTRHTNNLTIAQCKHHITKKQTPNEYIFHNKKKGEMHKKEWKTKLSITSCMQHIAKCLQVSDKMD